MIADLFTNVLEITLGISAVILLLLALSPVVGRRYAAKWRYWVWLALALRLALPFNLTLPQAAVVLPQPQAAVVYTPQEQRGEKQPAVQFSPQGDFAQQPVQQLTVSEPVPTQTAQPLPAPAETQKTPVRISVMELGAWLWLGGAAAFLLWQLGGYWVCRHNIRRWSVPICDAQTVALLEGLKAEMGITRPVGLYLCPRAASPMMTGVLRPAILLPEQPENLRELSFVLRHELVHLKRGDILYKQLMLLATALHWFNPLVWLMSREANRDIEISCDDTVVRELDLSERGEYGDIIMAAVRRGSLSAPAFTTYFRGNKRTIRQRLANLFDTGRKKKGTVALCAVIATAALASALVACGGAAQPEKQPEQEPPVVSAQETELREEGANDPGEKPAAPDPRSAMELAQVQEELSILYPERSQYTVLAEYKDYLIWTSWDEAAQDYRDLWRPFWFLVLQPQDDPDMRIFLRCLEGIDQEWTEDTDETNIKAYVYCQLESFEGRESALRFGDYAAARPLFGSSSDNHPTIYQPDEKKMLLFTGVDPSAWCVDNADPADGEVIDNAAYFFDQSGNYLLDGDLLIHAERYAALDQNSAYGVLTAEEYQTELTTIMVYDRSERRLVRLLTDESFPEIRVIDADRLMIITGEELRFYTMESAAQGEPVRLFDAAALGAQVRFESGYGLNLDQNNANLSAIFFHDAAAANPTWQVAVLEDGVLQERFDTGLPMDTGRNHNDDVLLRDGILYFTYNHPHDSRSYRYAVRVTGSDHALEMIPRTYEVPPTDTLRSYLALDHTAVASVKMEYIYSDYTYTYALEGPDAQHAAMKLLYTAVDRYGRAPYDLVRTRYILTMQNGATRTVTYDGVFRDGDFSVDGLCNLNMQYYASYAAAYPEKLYNYTFETTPTQTADVI